MWKIGREITKIKDDKKSLTICSILQFNPNLWNNLIKMQPNRACLSITSIHNLVSEESYLQDI